MSRIILSVVIVNWRSGNYVRRCVLSIGRYLSPINLRYEVIIIDNTPCDSELEKIAAFPKVRVVRNRANLGFAKACNVGARLACGELILFLNPDTEFVDTSLQTACAWLLRNRFAGVVGCRQVEPGGEFQPSSIQRFPTILSLMVDSRFTDACMHRGNVARIVRERPTPVEAVSGAFMLIRRSVFDDVGGFSEDYFIYTEDIDLCYKLRKAGYRSYYMSNVKVIHYGGTSTRLTGTSRFSVVMLRESMFRFFAKYHGKTTAWIYRLTQLLSCFARLLVLSVALLVVAPWKRQATAGLMNRLNKWRGAASWALGLEKWASSL